jgi:hypothetical protein
VTAILTWNGKGDTVETKAVGGAAPPKVATGLAAAAATEAFAKSAVDYARRNPGGSFEDLTTAVFSRVKELLRGIGSHPPELRFADAGALGVFKRDAWALIVNRHGDNGELRGKTLGELTPAQLGECPRGTCSTSPAR